MLPASHVVLCVHEHKENKHDIVCLCMQENTHMPQTLCLPTGAASAAVYSVVYLSVWV